MLDTRKSRLQHPCGSPIQAPRMARSILPRGAGLGVLAFVLLGALTPPPERMTGEQILEAMARNRDYDSIVFTGKLEIHVRGKVRVKTMVVKRLTRENKSIVEFTNPEDKGTRYLMAGDDLWIYFPDEDDTLRISGQMLKKGMMGSDVSYEDALETDTLSQKYDIQLAGEEVAGGRPCYVVTLTAKVRRVPYARRKMWVDKEWFIVWREEKYAKSGRLLKVARTLEVKEIDGRRVPTRTELSSRLRKNSRTIFEMTDVAFDVDLPEEMFSLPYLERQP